MWGPVPLPWYVLYEFVRQMSIGFMVTCGPRRTPAAPVGKSSRNSRRRSGHVAHAAEKIFRGAWPHAT